MSQLEERSEVGSSRASAPAGQMETEEAARRAADWATQTGRRQLAFLLEERDTAQQIAGRFANVDAAQRQGHVFEWMHELSFNLRAIAEDDDARLRVTTWLGEPHAAADLRIYGPDGGVLSEVQAKVVGNAARRLAASDGLAADKYRGMQLLVPNDHLEGTEVLLDKRLAMPDGPLHDRYADVRENLTDRVELGKIASDPIGTAGVVDAANDPQGYLQSMIRDGHLRDIAKAGGAAAVAGGLTSGLIDVAIGLARKGTVHELDWSEIGRRAARRAVRAGVAGCLAEGLSGLGQHAAAAGSGGWADGLAVGGLDHVVGNAVLSIAAIAHGVATGRLSNEDAGWAAAEALTKATAGWACAAIGQAIIPIPVVGAVVGSMVGQFGATLLVQGIRLAVTARDRSAAWDEEYDQLLRQTAELQASAAADLREVEKALATYEVSLRTRVLPRLVRLQGALAGECPDAVLLDLADISRLYLGTPLFASMAEFDELMADEQFTLVLDFGAGSS